jgi:hypothetical protein
MGHLSTTSAGAIRFGAETTTAGAPGINSTGSGCGGGVTLVKLTRVTTSVFAEA